MVDIGKVHQRSVQDFQAAFQDAQAEFQQANIADDVEGAAFAAQKMAALRASMKELNGMATEYVASRQAAQPSNRYGLSPEEVEVAKNFTADPRMSEDQKLATYAEQKAKYQHQRATGQYRDDQGTVRR